MTRLGRFEVQAVARNAWVGEDPLLPKQRVLVITSHQEDMYIYEQARLLAQIGADTPFRLLDIFLDESREMAGYVLVIPGPLKSSDEAVSVLGTIGFVRCVAKSLSALHKGRIAYRSFGDRSFGYSDGWGIPYDFCRASAIGKSEGSRLVDGIPLSDRIAEAGRRIMDFDPPEAVKSQYDGIRGDVYGLGHLMRRLGCGQDEGADLVAAMLDPDPRRRPHSIDAVLSTLGQR